MSDRTKKLKSKANLFGALSVLAIWAPALIWLILSFFTGEIAEKISLGSTTMLAIILTVLSAAFKKHWRTPSIILLVGLYLCVQSFTPVLLTVSCGIILDELILTPLYSKYKNRMIINAEIDKRG